MSFTAKTIKNACPKARQCKLTDERSLFLLVVSNGSKNWRLKCRFLGKEKCFSLGVWPEVSLAEAREKRDVAAR